MNDLISKLTNSIIRQEGMKSDALNPGNLRGAPWFVKPTIENGFWVPPSRQAGIAGISHVVALHVAKGENLQQLISSWAPSSDGNDTSAYVENVKQWCEIPNVTEPLWNFIEQVPS